MPFATELMTIGANHEHWRVYRTEDDEFVHASVERMRRAALLSRGSTRPIYEIAEEVGLANLTSFYQRFREYAGCTPQEYRRQG